MIAFSIIMLVLIVIALSIGCYNLIKTIERMEEANESEIASYQELLAEIREQALQTEARLKDIDIRGSFEADDEVGFVFKDIKEIHTRLTEIITEAYESGS